MTTRRFLLRLRRIHQRARMSEGPLRSPRQAWDRGRAPRSDRRGHDALGERLQAAEVRIERLKSAPKSASVENLLPRLPRLIRAHVQNSAQWISADVGLERSRARYLAEMGAGGNISPALI